jgi:hypothetical protein
VLRHKRQRVRRPCSQADQVSSATPHKVRAGDALLLSLSPPPPMEALPEALPLEVRRSRRCGKAFTAALLRSATGLR